MIDKNQAVIVKRAIGKAQWNLNYQQFCKRMGWNEDDWSAGKFRALTELARYLNEFDDNAFIKLIDAE
jgi:hypothetical protein